MIHLVIIGGSDAGISAALRAQVHWGFPDPSQMTGTEEERLAAFRNIRDFLAVRIRQFLAFHPTDSRGQFSAASLVVTQKQ